MKKPMFAFILLLSTLLNLPAQSSVPPSMDQLSNANVSSLAEDSEGYIWIGTARGLNRYNGSAYVVYYQQEGGLPDDFISSLCPDTGGRLWVGTGSGISLVRDGQVDPDFRIDAMRVAQVRSWDEGHLLFSTRQGLYMADKNGTRIQPVHLDSKLLYNTFFITRDRHVWIRNVSNNSFTILDESFRVIREFHVSGREIVGTFEDRDESIYFYTSNGLLRYGSDGRQLPVDSAIRTRTEGKHILFLVRTGEALLAGIRNEGILDLSDGSREWPEESLTGLQNCMVLATKDNLWLSPNRHGLRNLYMHADDHSIPRPERFAADALNMFYPIGGGQILVITNKGVFRQHIRSGSWETLEGPGINGEDKLGITLLDKRGHLWIQHNYDEIRKYAIQGNRLDLKGIWPIEPTNSIWNDATGNVCLLQSESILRFTPDNRQERLETHGHPEFWFCGQFASGKPYFLADDAVWFLEADSRFEKWDLNLQEPTCIWEDGNGDWWIGTRHTGIWHYVLSDRSLRPVNMGGEDVDRYIMSIAGDRDGNIWASTRFDYVRISQNGENVQFLKNPDENAIGNNTNSIAVTENGTVLFGSQRAFTYFLANASVQTGRIPLTLDRLILNGETVLDRLPESAVFDHTVRQMVFYFSGKNFDPGFQPGYQYRLDGYDTGWIDAGQTPRAGFSGLRSGRYTFRVRVRQQDGSWSPDELTLPFRIKPSPWLSWTAVLLYLAVLLGLLLLGIRQFIRFRLNKEKLELSEQEKKLAEQISQERTTFFTNVSHEFRTPLSLIYGPVKELGKSPSLSEEDRKLVGIIERNSERMLRLTDQLLHFSQSRDNRDKLSVMQTDLSILLRRMLKNFEYMFRQKNLRVTTGIPAETPVYCDREKVERIVFNLLSNAVKYTPEHGEIHVEITREAEEVAISVADTGIGISPDKAERIFERFERLGEQVGTDIPSGFGIGLNYAKHLAVIHKGDLTVRPNDPIGSVFTFRFPASKDKYSDDVIWEEETTGSAVPTTTEQPDGPGEKAGILIVEDNADMREYIRGFLGKEYNIMTAGDGEEAWNLIRLSLPDLIVSDVMMPYKDGYTLCKELKNDPEYCHIPVILLTAKADMENQIHGLNLGADGYLGKPFDPAYLTALVRNLLSGRKRLQGLLREQTSATEGQIETLEINAQDKTFLERCYKIIDEHIGEEDFGVTALSMEMGMSRTSIFSKLKALVGQSPQAFLNDYRLNRAMELLKSHKYNVSEVGYKVGFSTLTGFSRAFKNKFGIPPSLV